MVFTRVVTVALLLTFSSLAASADPEPDREIFVFRTSLCNLKYTDNLSGTRTDAACNLMMIRTGGELRVAFAGDNRMPQWFSLLFFGKDEGSSQRLHPPMSVENVKVIDPLTNVTSAALPGGLCTFAYIGSLSNALTEVECHTKTALGSLDADAQNLVPVH